MHFKLSQCHSLIILSGSHLLRGRGTGFTPVIVFLELKLRTSGLTRRKCSSDGREAKSGLPWDSKVSLAAAPLGPVRTGHPTTAGRPGGAEREQGRACPSSSVLQDVLGAPGGQRSPASPPPHLVVSSSTFPLTKAPQPRLPGKLHRERVQDTLGLM